MDERRRLLERAFSREGADETPEERVDPLSGETVSMTPSQWALADYDRRTRAAGGASEGAGLRAPHGGADERDATDADDADATADVPADAGRGDGVGQRSSRTRRAIPYLAAAGGLVLGVVVGLGVQSIVGPSLSGGSSTTTGADGPRTLSPAPNGVAAQKPGEGDEGATLVTVTRFFEETPRAAHLSTDITHGYDAESFHPLTGTVDMSRAMYAARRLDDQYCLVAVEGGARAAATCGSMDDIARRGLRLTMDSAGERDEIPVSIAATWATDGTISWGALPDDG